MMMAMMEFLPRRKSPEYPISMQHAHAHYLYKHKNCTSKEYIFFRDFAESICWQKKIFTYRQTRCQLDLNKYLNEQWDVFRDVAIQISAMINKYDK